MKNFGELLSYCHTTMFKLNIIKFKPSTRFHKIFIRSSRKFSRPRLTVSFANETSFRPAHSTKSTAGYFLLHKRVVTSY